MPGSRLFPAAARGVDHPGRRAAEHERLLADRLPAPADQARCEQAPSQGHPSGEQAEAEEVSLPEPDHAHGTHAVTVEPATFPPSPPGHALVVHQRARLVPAGATGTQHPVEEIHVEGALAGGARPEPRVASAHPLEPFPADGEIVAAAHQPGQGLPAELPPGGTGTRGHRMSPGARRLEREHPSGHESQERIGGEQAGEGGDPTRVGHTVVVDHRHNGCRAVTKGRVLRAGQPVVAPMDPAHRDARAPALHQGACARMGALVGHHHLGGYLLPGEE